MASAASLLSPLCALVLAPLLLGIINRTKAFVAGRRGPPLLQPYRDVAEGAAARRRLRRGDELGVSPRPGRQSGLPWRQHCSSSPLGGIAAPVSFAGDLIVLVGLLALGRFATVLAALDTGSSFEGMGASREAHFAALAEPALLLALADAGARATGAIVADRRSTARSPRRVGRRHRRPRHGRDRRCLCPRLVENARVPVDDPTTHLELTMIHEVMVLDHSGPDFAYIHYAAALKLWLVGSLLVGLVVPVRGRWWLCLAAMLLGMAVLGRRHRDDRVGDGADTGC